MSPLVGTLTAATYGKYRSRDHSSATALHRVLTTVYGTWGGGRPTEATAPTGSEGSRRKARCVYTFNTSIMKVDLNPHSGLIDHCMLLGLKQLSKVHFFIFHIVV